MRELSHEESLEAAKLIKEMVELARKLDVEYLTECVTEMKKNHSFRNSAMILSSSPFTVMESQDLDAAKIKGLELMIELAENQERVLELTINLQRAKSYSNDLNRMFEI